MGGQLGRGLAGVISAHRRRLMVAACFLLLLGAVPTFAGEKQGPHSHGPPADDAWTKQKAENERAAEKEWKEKRDKPEAREERKRSRKEFKHKSKHDSLEVLHGKHKELVDHKAWKPVDLRDGERVESFHGDYDARVVDDNGNRRLVESTSPMRSTIGSGRDELVDLSLEDHGNDFAPKNPVLPVTISKRLAGGVTLSPDLRFTVAGDEPDGGPELTSDHAFFSNVATDSDLIVNPAPEGAQLSWQLRSQDSPESVSLDFTVPTGATLRMADDAPKNVEGAQPSGAAEIVRGDDLIARIEPPAAWDADGAPVEDVSYAVDGDRLVVRIPHRGQDLRYPLALDPLVEDWRVTSANDTHHTGPPFLFGQYGETAAWYFDSNRPSGHFWNCSQTYGSCLSSNGGVNTAVGLGIQMHGGNTTDYPDLSYGQWLWIAPRQSYIYRARYYGVYHAPAGLYPDNDCVEEGVWSFSRFDWERNGSRWQPYWGGMTGGSPWFGTTPGYPATDGATNTCGNLTNNYADHWPSGPNGPTPGSPAFVFRLQANGAGPRTNQAHAYMDEAAIELDDRTTPRVASHTISPSGWVKGGTTVTHSVRTIDGATDNENDAGLGIWATNVSVPEEGGGKKDYFAWNSCDRRLSRCPASQTRNVSYSVDDVDPDTAGQQRMPEGVNNVAVTPTDPAGKQPSPLPTVQVKVDRTLPTMDIDGSLAPPTDSPWVATGNQDLSIDANDAGSGVKHVELQIDGRVVAQSDQSPGASGGDPLSLDAVVNTDDPIYTEGEHTLTARAVDATGQAKQDSWTVRFERTAPALNLTGPLRNAEGQTLTPGSTYTLTASSTDALGLAPQAGLGRIEFSVDNDTPKTVEQPCPIGSCPFSSSFNYVVDDWDAGEHTISVTATDLAGNATTQSFKVGNPQPEPAACPAPPPTAISSSVLPAVDPVVAEQLFRTQLPEGFQQWSPLTYGSTTVHPTMSATPADVFVAADSLNEATADKNASDGATLAAYSDDGLPTCLTPTAVSSNASAPRGPISGTDVLYANSAAATDTLVRPTATGIESFSMLRDGTAPSQFSWNLGLQPGQQLKMLPDGAAAIVEPAPAGTDPLTPIESLPAQPSLADQRRAVTDTGLQVQLASDERERADEAIPDTIVAVIPKPWAKDQLDRPVATSLSVSGSTLQMQVQHSPTTTAYPVVANNEFASADSIDEEQALRDDSQTANYTAADVNEDLAPEPGVVPETLTPPTADPAFAEPEGFASDPSAGADEEPDPESSTTYVAEPDSAPTADEAANRFPTIALTESHPAVLYSPERVELRPKAQRPAVPWNVVKLATGTSADQQRAKLWTDWYRIATTGSLGRKGSAEKSNGIPTDVAFESWGKKLPSPRRYGNALTDFFKKFPGIARNVSAWNEPQERSNLARNNPFRAARFWIAAQRVCRPSGRSARCSGDVVAGEYAGTRSSVRYKRKGFVKTADGHERQQDRTYRYEVDYREYLYSRVDRKGVPKSQKIHSPRVWGFHAYGDVRRRELLRGTGDRPRVSTMPVTKHYYREHTSGKYRDAQLWMTAVGAPYTMSCDEAGTYAPCPSTNPAKSKVLLGTAKQRDGMAFLLKQVIKKYPDIGRVYYYALHNTKNAKTYQPDPATLPAGTDGSQFKGRCCLTPLDRGLVGADNDTSTPGNTVDDRSRGAYSRPWSVASPYRRSLFCLMRDRRLSSRRC